jgi:putative two-component system response regulator
VLDPDLLLLDLRMPRVDGLTVLQVVRESLAPEEYRPIIVLTADSTGETRRRALALGATDFLTKPFDVVEVLMRVSNALETRMLHRELREHNLHLDAMVAVRTAELERSRIELLERLARAAEYRDDDTGRHAWRVGENSGRVAELLGCPAETIALIRRAATLHDIGKIAIPDSILLKPGPLTEREMETMRTHTTIGAEILRGSESPLLQMAERIALTHHEWWNGGGYPHLLSGTRIPLEGRIVGAADVLDAVLHQRPYRPAWTIDMGLAEIRRLDGRHLDPDVVRACEQLVTRNELLYEGAAAAA